MGKANRQHPESQIAHYDKVYAKDQPAEIGHIIRCPNLGATPDEWHAENFIKGAERWTRVGQATYAEVAALCDHPECLWNTGSSSQNGQNDRVAVVDAENMDHSLLLVHATDIVLMAQPVGNGKLKQRVAFDYLGTRYDLSITR